MTKLFYKAEAENDSFNLFAKLEDISGRLPENVQPITVVQADTSIGDASWSVVFLIVILVVKNRSLKTEVVVNAKQNDRFGVKRNKNASFAIFLKSNLAAKILPTVKQN